MMQKLYDRISALSEKDALLISGFIKSFIYERMCLRKYSIICSQPIA